PRAILGRSVQDVAVDERGPRGARGSDVRLHRIQCVRFPRPLEAPRMPHERRHVFAHLAPGAGEPPPAIVTEDGGVEGRDAGSEVGGPIGAGAEPIRADPPAVRRIEATDARLAAGSEGTFDGLLRDADAPCLVAEEPRRGPTDSLSGLPAEEADHLTVRRNG